MASRTDDILRSASSPPGQLHPAAPDAVTSARWVRGATQPMSARFGLVGALEGRSNTGSSRIPLRLASRARTIWQFWYDSSLSGPLSTLTPVPGIRLPSASTRCCDSGNVVVSHLHSVKQRLAAHQVGDPQLVRGGRGELAVDQIGMAARGGIGFGGADAFATAQLLLCRRRACAGRPDHGPRRGRPDGRLSTTCGHRRRDSCPPRAGAAPGPSRRHGTPASTAPGFVRRSKCSGPPTPLRCAGRCRHRMCSKVNRRGDSWVLADARMP